MIIQPLISVLTTAFNREKYIAEAIESVLASTYENFELIIVDDCSTDNTVNIAQEYAAKDDRIKVYVNETNLGDYPNRNKAASYAQGKYIKYLDSDDIMFPECLKVMVESMEQFPEAGFGLSSIDVKHFSDIKCLSPKESYKDHFYKNSIFNRAPGSSIIKRESFIEKGGFSGLNQVGDFELWLKMGCYFHLVKLPVNLYRSRDHSDRQLNLNTVDEKKEMKRKVLEEIFSKDSVPLTQTEKEKILQNKNLQDSKLKQFTKLYFK